MNRSAEFALVGDPVRHSRSPAIHKAAFAALGIKGRYRAVRADVASLETLIERLREGEMAGLNVTMPLKAGAFALADVHTPEAEIVGSVNTLRAAGGRVEGHSTDAVAMESLMERLLGEGDDTPVLVLGAGGSASAAMILAAKRPVYVGARRHQQGATLASRFDGVEAVAWGVGVAGAVVINATPLGMNGESLPEPVLAVARGIIDLPYGALPTPATQWAESKGISAIDGVEFLVAQAEESLRWWTGLEPPHEAMINAARKA